MPTSMNERSFPLAEIAEAARLLSGPAEIVFTRMSHLRPASYASTFVSDSSCAFADDIPPP